MEKIQGRVWEFTDNIDTDLIIPDRYLRTFNSQYLVDHVLDI